MHSKQYHQQSTPPSDAANAIKTKEQWQYKIINKAYLDVLKVMRVSYVARMLTHHVTLAEVLPTSRARQDIRHFFII